MGRRSKTCYFLLLNAARSTAKSFTGIKLYQLCLKEKIYFVFVTDCGMTLDIPEDKHSTAVHHQSVLPLASQQDYHYKFEESQRI